MLIVESSKSLISAIIQIGIMKILQLIIVATAPEDKGK